MWNRQGKDQADPDPAPVSPEDAGSPWDLWEDKWAGTEQERVARWLQSKVGSRSMAAVDVRGDRVNSMASHRGVDQARAVSREVESMRAEVAAIEEERRYVTAQIDAGRAELAAVEEQYRLQVAALEAVMATFATAQEQHQRLVDGMEAAVVTAERSRLAELDALARYEVAEERHKQMEAERFELWAALDAEITALDQRRDNLRGTGAGPTA